MSMALQSSMQVKLFLRRDIYEDKFKNNQFNMSNKNLI